MPTSACAHTTTEEMATADKHADKHTQTQRKWPQQTMTLTCIIVGQHIRRTVPHGGLSSPHSERTSCVGPQFWCVLQDTLQDANAPGKRTNTCSGRMDWPGENGLARAELIGTGRMDWLGQNGLARADWIGSGRMDGLGHHGLGRMDWLEQNGLARAEWIGSGRTDWLKQNGLVQAEWIGWGRVENLAPMDRPHQAHCRDETPQHKTTANVPNASSAHLKPSCCVCEL